MLFGIPAGTAQAANIVTTTGTTISPAEQQQTGILERDNVPSDCVGTLKLAPSLNNQDPRRYRVHTFSNSLTNPVCITASFSTSCSVFSAAYFGQFNPADILENYAADMGWSTPTRTSYAFAPGGGQRFAIVVHEVSPNAGCAGYNLTVTSDRPWANSVPTINGAPTPGSVLTGTNATWSVTPVAPSVERRWVRCDEVGANCVDIPGATGATYTVTDADVGQTLRFRNHATDAGGTSTSQSPAVEPFIPFESHDGSLGPGDRVLKGVFIRNSVESRCVTPNAAPTILSPASFYLYDAYPVTSLLNEPVCLGARMVPTACISGTALQIYNPAFDPVAGLAANYAGNSGGDPLAVGTASVPLGAGGGSEVVVSEGPSSGSCNSYAVTIGANAPFATARPTLSGTPVEGGALTATDGTWSGAPAIGRSWRRCDTDGNACAPIDGATGVSYTPTTGDVGSRLRVRVTAVQGKSVSSDSEPSEIVAAAPGPPGPGGGESPQDRDPPDGRIRKVKVKGDGVKVYFRSDEEPSTFQCRLDKRRFKPCTSPKRYRNLREGKHRVFVLATDAAGNKDDKAAKAKFKVR